MVVRFRMLNLTGSTIVSTIQLGASLDKAREFKITVILRQDFDWRTHKIYSFCPELRQKG
jgi:hypothetical protein